MRLFGPRYPERYKVLVSLKTADDDRGIRGVLWEEGERFLILKGATFEREKMAPIAIDGDCVIYRENVLFLQVLPV